MENVIATIDFGCVVCGQVASDLIRACEPGELGRKTFEHVSAALGAVVCTNFQLDPATQPVRTVGIVRDITARKAHEEHVQLLMRELDHRVKHCAGDSPPDCGS